MFSLVMQNLLLCLFQFAEYHLLGIPCFFEQSGVSRKRKEVTATLLLYEGILSSSTVHLIVN